MATVSLKLAIFQLPTATFFFCQKRLATNLATNLATFPGLLETNVSVRFSVPKHYCSSAVVFLSEKQSCREKLPRAKLLAGGFSLELRAASSCRQ